MDTPFTSGVFTMSTAHVDVPDFCNSGFLPNGRKLLPSTQIATYKSGSPLSNKKMNTAISNAELLMGLVFMLIPSLTRRAAHNYCQGRGQRAENREWHWARSVVSRQSSY
jgi:hypothetical protein